MRASGAQMPPRRNGENWEDGHRTAGEGVAELEQSGIATLPENDSPESTELNRGASPSPGALLA